ncbi:thioesterase family protein [Aeromicrobium choanae]|uniref:Thioesterase superfamily n=1 Tax=Aeromicrobium choanae TaxID=1736691 RepID=A0A1T4Z5N0_9ACTN|nr:hotdog domain-containing protein [Aeromicrobium choanae]SKB09183.1 Thioesterase superfamily [Aeromicrobium choanae]
MSVAGDASHATVTHTVGPEHTARAVGSGDLEVLGTPVLLAWLEEATCAALDLAEGQTSVGTRVEVQHLAASGVGATITTTASLTQRDGRMVIFEVSARDRNEVLVASGQVRRVVVDRERFLSRVPTVD